MGRYLSFPILVVVVVLQSTLVPIIRIGGGGPDLLLMVVLSWTMLAGLEEGLIWAMVGGILQDLVIGLPTGTTALALVILAGLTSFVFGPVGSGNLVIPPIVLAVGTVLYELLLGITLAVLGRLSVMGQVADINYVLTYITLPTLMYNVILILPIFRVMGLIFKASRPSRVSL